MRAWPTVVFVALSTREMRRAWNPTGSSEESIVIFSVVSPSAGTIIAKFSSIAWGVVGAKL